MFTIEQARRALPYVSRAVRDAQDAYLSAQRCRRMLASMCTPREREELCAQRDAAVRRLNTTIDECEAVGADLVDLADGVVSFPAALDARPVSLIWRPEEPVGSAWSDLA